MNRWAQNSKKNYRHYEETLREGILLYYTLLVWGYWSRIERRNEY